MGVIYVLKPSNEDPSIKIGRTKYLPERIKHHKTKWPNLKLIGYLEIDDEIRFEKVIIDTLKSFQLGNKELFILSESDYHSVKRKISNWLIEYNSPSPTNYTDACQCWGPDGKAFYVIPPDWKSQGTEIHNIILKAI
ncbi:GIY-YIG nuclease family protein [uncultured Paraglaciecola sp.]|uniref:GIY-YIG nuclease family protein n=1 Tax=uncultured Paraglaciecola sp. TaxID=1765024 RepID=UPI002615C61F|nr:GIY-YIG nuclease family protein [uncultured Paraglaciecola sp.]